ncbi:KOW domain-containing RNA-binding protein [Clostridium omnivorum]|uniref:Ribosomal protein L14E (/ type) n=1 Tax=Clostridium omnivorum TaxID=1604902 RepID=A0ABQ5N3K0_9CLOT|nr:KOW domain-containing RNA-binding protein [Clostridium sp. E14]GLC29793.1 ribosomal protein L14E (/ type) [Clostridium sp. E14]
MNENNYLGRVVFSKTGRDMGRKFIIVDTINENYVLIADGDLRKVEKPKKKKIKHLSISNKVIDSLKELILAGEKVSNSVIREFLQSVDIYKEV